MRLFIALNIGDRVKDSLMEYTKMLVGEGVGGRFLPRDNLHLTLVFLGEMDSLQQAKDAMDEACKPHASFEFGIGGLGRFRKEGGDVLWAGIHADPALFALQKDLCQTLSLKGFLLENRRYKPHLTLARQAFLPRDLAVDAPALHLPEMVQRVKAVSLMESLRENGNLVYREKYRVTLSGSEMNG